MYNDRYGCVLTAEINGDDYFFTRVNVVIQLYRGETLIIHDDCGLCICSLRVVHIHLCSGGLRYRIAALGNCGYRVYGAVFKRGGAQQVRQGDALEFRIIHALSPGYRYGRIVRGKGELHFQSVCGKTYLISAYGKGGRRYNSPANHNFEYRGICGSLRTLHRRKFHGMLTGGKSRVVQHITIYRILHFSAAILRYLGRIHCYLHGSAVIYAYHIMFGSLNILPCEHFVGLLSYNGCAAQRNGFFLARGKDADCNNCHNQY